MTPEELDDLVARTLGRPAPPRLVDVQQEMITTLKRSIAALERICRAQGETITTLRAALDRSGQAQNEGLPPGEAGA